MGWFGGCSWYFVNRWCILLLCVLVLRLFISMVCGKFVSILLMKVSCLVCVGVLSERWVIIIVSVLLFLLKCVSIVLCLGMWLGSG